MKSRDRRQLESLRTSVAHLAHALGMKDPLIQGSVNAWLHKAKTEERGWNALIADMVLKVNAQNEAKRLKHEFDTTG